MFIHIPKNAGTSIRAVFPQAHDRQTFGYIPPDWADAYTFAVVRNPFTRFLSAFHMFKHGAGVEGDYYATPRWPDLTVDDALAVLADDTVPFDRSVRNLPANLKHHLLPQTHPFNCLHYAHRLLRHETLQDDFKAVARHLGLPTLMPHLRNGHHSTLDQLQADLSTAQIARIQELYQKDFDQLGYASNGDIQRWPYVTAPSEAAVWPLWPMYYSNMVVQANDADAALPREDVPLEPFLHALVPGPSGQTWAGREKDLNKHFHKLQPEFAGSPRLAHLLACVIVTLRRRADCARARTLFLRILEHHGADVAKTLNLRWLTSVCDTVMDVSVDPLDRSLALTGSLLANTVKLYETELSVFHPRIAWPPRVRFRNSGELFDGLIAFWTEKGDMIKNLQARAEACLSSEARVAPFVREVFHRCLTRNTVFTRMHQMAGSGSPPLLDEALRRSLEMALHDLDARVPTEG